MSLLTTGPHTVTVYPRVYGTVGATNRRTLVDAPSVVISGVMVQPVKGAQGESGNIIPLAEADYWVLGQGTWPPGIAQKVRWNGRDYDQVGEAALNTSGRSGRTHHFKVRISLRALPVGVA